MRLNEVIAKVDDGATTHLADVAQSLGLAVDSPASAALPTVDLPAAQLKSRRLETRLMMLVGAGFGLGVALTLSRLLADLAPGLTVAGAVACAAIGLGLTVWVVGTRGLLRDRALLDRWTGEATALVQSAVEQLVATRVLAAESSLTAALGEQDEGESARVAEQVSEPAGPGDGESDASGAPSETSVPSDAEGGEIDETSSTNTADNAI